MYEPFNEWFPSIYHIPGWWGVPDDYEGLIDLTAAARDFTLTARES